MYHDEPGKDYLKRAMSRLKARDVLMAEKSWADVVREARETIEFTLKAVLRFCRIEVPRIYDVSPVLEHNLNLLPKEITEKLGELVRISKLLRRDRELAFYGSEDLTASEFYTRKDAATALQQAHLVHETVCLALKQP